MHRPCEEKIKNVLQDKLGIEKSRKNKKEKQNKTKRKNPLKPKPSKINQCSTLQTYLLFKHMPRDRESLLLSCHCVLCKLTSRRYVFTVLNNSLSSQVWFSAFQFFHFVNCTCFLAASTFWKISCLSPLEMLDHNIITSAVPGSSQGCHPHKFF